MFMASEIPQLCIDWDGTAVTGLDPRERIKLPMEIMPGFPDFIKAVSKQPVEGEPQVEIAEVFTMRPRIFLPFTMSEIKKYGLSEYFQGRDQLVHVPSEKGRAGFLVAKSESVKKVGMLDNRPHCLAPPILDAFSTKRSMEMTDERSILLGVVKHEEKSQARIRKFLDWTRKNYGNLTIGEFDYGTDENADGVGYRIKVGHATLDIVQLGQYCEEEGDRFRQRFVQSSR
jgi:hypothetical protein